MEQFCSRHSHGLWSTYYNTPLSLNEETNFEAFHAGEFLTKIDKKNCTRRGSTFHSEMTMVKMVEEEKKKRGSGFSNAGGEFCIPWDMHCALHRREEKGLTSKFPKEKKKKRIPDRPKEYERSRWSIRTSSSINPRQETHCCYWRKNPCRPEIGVISDKNNVF